jgi:hypothetical protein
MVEWYKQGGVLVFEIDDCQGDDTILGLVRVIAKLQARVGALERRLLED